MAPVKRKSGSDHSVSKNSNKRQRADSTAKAQPVTSNKENHKPDVKLVKPVATSVLAKEQPAFPRGGAGLLTPLERKQIQAKAARDVAAEQRHDGDLFSSKHNDVNNSDSDELDDEKNVTGGREKQKQRSTKRTKVKAKSVSSEDAIPIEGLSYKRLTTESLILGCVSCVNTQDITISLPNNLTGFVPLSEVSNVFSEKVRAALNKEDNKDEDADNDQDEEVDDISLKSHFRQGQYVRVAVTSLGDDESSNKSQSKRKINLSLDPRKTNVGLSKTSLVPGCIVQAAVISVEDHGMVMDLGLDGKHSIRGFVPTKALEPSMTLDSIRTGTVLLCSVTSAGPNDKIIRLSPDFSKASLLKNPPTVDTLLPGTFVETLITEITTDGIAGKLMGLVDVTADIVHSGSFKNRETFVNKFVIGQKVKGRLICTFPLAEKKRLGFSILPDVVSLTPALKHDATALQVSSILPSARVVRVSSGLGIYLALPSGHFGFAHISRLSDKKVESVSETLGPYKLESEHQVRILDFNAVDDLYILSLQKKVIQQPFLRVEDVTVGEVVKATIEKVLIGPAGVQGLIVNLAEGVTGLVPQIHMSDISLLHPEKKFREGASVNARILSVDRDKRQIRMTLKKALVNSDTVAWAKIEDISVGDSTVGTLVKVNPHGALVQFYGSVKGFLPVSEMSEAYIKDATEHFKVGQVLTVHAISVDPEENRLTISCRDQSASTEASLASIEPGTLTSGVVFEKSQKDLLSRLDKSDVIARISLDHISDGSERKRRSALEKIRVGQRLSDILILDVKRKDRLVNLCNRQTLIKAAQNGQFLKSFEDLKEGSLLTGFISNITEDGVFVRFAHGITGLITKRQVPSEAEELPSFGMQVLQAVSAKVISIDYKGATPRFWLSMRETPVSESKQQPIPDRAAAENPIIVNPVDDAITNFAQFSIGTITKARVTSIKDTQLNIELAKDIQGRIDVSEIFDKWEDIKDRKHPLKSFNQKQIIPVKILGSYDTRNHRFLPLSHRTGKNTVFECSMKSSVLQSPDHKILSLSDVLVGSSWLAYVNYVGDDYLMVNISPSVRGRIKAIDVSDDLSLATDLKASFPLGSALRVRVLSADAEKGRLDLTAKSSESTRPSTLEELVPGSILPGRVTKISDRSILVQLGENVVGAVDLIDMADDYSQCNTAKYQKNDIVRVCVLRVDTPNRKVVLSARPSRVLSSSLETVDPEIKNVKQLEVNQIVRGFVSNVADKGLFITLSQEVTAFVRVTDLSDAFLKNWKDNFQRDQLVKGKVVAIDHDSGHVRLSLKASIMDANYTPPRTFTTTAVGEIVTGKVVKVETFGVFILVDNSENVRGLCHRSEMAEQKIEDASKLFTEGDVIKAKVLKVDLPNRRINFGMKASYLADADEDDEMEDVDDDESADEDFEGSGLDEGALLSGDLDMEEANLTDGESETEAVEVVDAMGADNGLEDHRNDNKRAGGLSVGGFDWFGMSMADHSASHSTDPATATTQSKKKKRKAEIQIDRTGDLDANGPQSTDDFERLLLGEPDSSMLWLQYMAFYLELGDMDQARAVGERAIKTISLGQDAEKMNVWIALLNLENAYGDNDSIEAVFKRACKYNDPQEVYNRLGSIYIQSGKHSKADELFQASLKKFTQEPKVYINYATFLFDTMGDADKGRALLSRALQILPSFTHFDITSKFAQLEFKSSAGLSERGRTIFEGLINSFPKRVDLFNVMLDMEMQHGDTETDPGDQVRSLFERIFERKLKPKQAKYFFKRWLSFEEEKGDERKIDEVKAKAATWVKQSGQV